MEQIMKLCLAAAVMVLAVSSAHGADKATFRALVADHANGKLTLIELPTGKAIGHYGVEGPARLKPNAAGRLIYVTQGNQGRINVFDSGISTVSHGDHFDVEVKVPRLLDANFTGGKPSHVNYGFGSTAFFFDESGAAQIVEESTISSGKLRISTIKTAAPHHGLGAPLRGHFAMSVPHPTEAKGAPVGIDVVKRDGGSIAKSTECPRLHGEARLDSISAFGCADGMLFLTEEKGKFSFQKVVYPDNIPKERMVRNLLGSHSVRSFLGDFGADGMVVIDPVTRGFTFVQLPSRRMSFGRDPLLGALSFVMTEEGQLRRINALTGKLDQSLPVTEPYSMEGGFQVARPRISASGGMVVVTDPARGKIHIVDGEAMKLLKTVDVSGAPFDVAVVGAADADH
jgi:zinc transport system substrate-binding protein